VGRARSPAAGSGAGAAVAGSAAAWSAAGAAAEPAASRVRFVRATVPSPFVALRHRSPAGYSEAASPAASDRSAGVAILTRRRRSNR
jgi:hypothetical protein